MWLCLSPLIMSLNTYWLNVARSSSSSSSFQPICYPHHFCHETPTPATVYKQSLKVNQGNPFSPSCPSSTSPNWSSPDQHCQQALHQYCGQSGLSMVQLWYCWPCLLTCHSRSTSHKSEWACYMEEWWYSDNWPHRGQLMPGKLPKATSSIRFMPKNHLEPTAFLLGVMEVRLEAVKRRRWLRRRRR